MPEPDQPSLGPAVAAPTGTVIDRKAALISGLLLLIAAFAHNLFHELGHWSVGRVLGNPMSMSLNYAWPASGHYLADWHAPVVLMGGPAFSILMAAGALVIVEQTGRHALFPFLFFPLYSRLFSLLFGGFAKQDEAAIAALLDLGPYTVAVLVCAVLLVVVWSGSRKLALTPRAIGWWCVGAVVAQLAVIGTDRFLL